MESNVKTMNENVCVCIYVCAIKNKNVYEQLKRIKEFDVKKTLPQNDHRIPKNTLGEVDD